MITGDNCHATVISQEILEKRSGQQQPPFSPMYSAQIRSSRTFLQKQIPSSQSVTANGFGDLDSGIQGTGYGVQLFSPKVRGLRGLFR